MIDRVAYLIHAPTPLVKEPQLDSEDDAPGSRQVQDMLKPGLGLLSPTLPETSCSHIWPVM